ncbi:MAG: GGDEF domain-containing protein [Burkholderiaceae bacterium]|nr:GGDEF domain-containing protein [Burkholderiaceae bacterium]
MPAHLFRAARWSRRAQHVVMALGPPVATILLTGIVSLLALAVTHATLTLAGGGDRWLATVAALLCAALITPPMAWPLLHLLCALEAARAQLDVLATRDELTGLYNRRQFLVLADREWSRCRRYDMAAALLMIDVDLFKRVNDEHGHLAGDLMLREIARAAGDTLRQPDLLGRFGGEEFVVFLPHADPLGAIDAAERIRERVARLCFEWKGQAVRATVSIGVATFDLTHDSLAALIQDADMALYAAKDAGRNCVRAVPPQAREHGASDAVVSP